ncbi:hypothetical protein RG47T_0510 [Mucilaginibacter polytrichastri]|uniref:Uncharacterized protein n=1 Tax=Mucilaginibacter polytrichastri TaxID=1302689 RepID=A0A1Q5ZTH5_9SPHI|nr:hypothetical protein RG47T_0510 [Mucilaginibacter polytrichastri]
MVLSGFYQGHANLSTQLKLVCCVCLRPVNKKAAAVIQIH